MNRRPDAAQNPEVDLLFLTRDASPPREDVRRGIEVQGGVPDNWR